MHKNLLIPVHPQAGRISRTALLARGLALFLGAFTLLNLAGGLRVPGFGLNLWWIDLRALPEYLADPLLGTARETYFLRQLPFNMAREVAAIWVYYFRPLVAA